MGVNLVCVFVVVRRGRQLQLGTGDEPLWRASRIVLGCFVTGLLAAVAATFGFRFALQRFG